MRGIFHRELDKTSVPIDLARLAKRAIIQFHTVDKELLALDLGTLEDVNKDCLITAQVVHTIEDYFYEEDADNRATREVWLDVYYHLLQ